MLQAHAGSGPADRVEYYTAILGPENQDYYLDQFDRFDCDGDINPTWHWPAFFVSFLWLLYRKMWVPAVVYFFAPLLLLGFLSVTGSIILTSLGYLLYTVGVVALFPMYANALYYRHCKKQIAAVSASSADVQQQLGELSARGGTSSVKVIGVAAAASVAVIGIFAAIAIPVYQNYSVKAHTEQAYALGKAASGKVSEFYASHGAIPSSLSEAGFAQPIPSYVRDISMNPRKGAVTVTMDGPVVGGKSLTLEPLLNRSGQLDWDCTSEQIQASYLPQPCRHQNGT
ncbi:MAG TPA: pilin [Gallionellaceae bacterium]